MAASPLILLIDSDAQRLRAMSLLLQRAGYLVLVENQTSNLIALLQAYDISLILIQEHCYSDAESQLQKVLDCQICCPSGGVVVLTDDREAKTLDLTGHVTTLVWNADDLLNQLSALLAPYTDLPDTTHPIKNTTPLEKALAESHEQLLAVLDGMDADVYVADMETYTILFMNEHMRASFGDDLIGKPCYPYFRGTDIPCLNCTNPQLLDADGNPTDSVTWEGRNEITNRWYINYDRAIKWVDGRYVRLEVSTDITDMKLAEEALIGERNRAQQYLDVAEVMIFALDADGTITMANQKTCEILGLPQQEIIGKNWFDSFIPDDIRERKQQAYQSALVGETPAIEHYRDRIVIAGGTEHIVNWHNKALEDENGAYIGVLSSGEVITDRVKTEMALLRSEDRLAKTLLATNDGIWDWNLVTNEVYFDERYYTMAGYEVDVFPHNMDAFIERVHPDDVTYVMAEMQRHLDGKTERLSMEFRFRKADGRYMWIMGRGIIVERNADGTPLRFIGTHTDISLRKSVEKTRAQLATRVRTQAQQMAQILATVPAGVLLLNGEGRVLQANPVAEQELEKLTGAQPGEVISYFGDYKLHDLFTSPVTGIGWHEVRSPGSIYEVIARPVEVGTEPEHWVLAFTDVTKAREVQAQLQQREQLAAVGQLAAGIAHDFNNILASIVLYAQLMGQSHELSPAQKERVNIIDRQAQSAAQLVEQMLDFSRRAVLARRPMDLLPLIKEQVKMLERSLPEHISIKLDYDYKTCVVNADPTRMQQMLMNLAVNARDAMPEGGILRFKLEHLTVTNNWSPLLPKMEPGPWVRIAVEDTGTGIAADVLPHIFEPFYTTKEPGKGSGLGLAQVHGIVGQHGGRIGIDTVEGEGTTFNIYFPAILQEAESESDDGEGQVFGHGETLLVVEDNTILRIALADSLEQLDYRVLVAPNGKVALSMLAEHPEIGLVLSDLVMPVMGGQAMFQALRGQGYTLPVVMLTGHPMQQELEVLREQGLFDWMLKPPDIEELSQVIARALRKGKQAHV